MTTKFATTKIYLDRSNISVTRLAHHLFIFLLIRILVIQLVGGFTARASAHILSPTSEIVVNSTADTQIDNDGFCTLREAITNANADSDTTGGDCLAGDEADTIILSSSVITPATILLYSELPTIIDESVLTILGPGPEANGLVLDAGESTRVFFVSGSLTLDHLTVKDGYSPYAGGGLINANGTVNISNSAFYSNTTYANYGGGIYNSGGTVNIINSYFANNSTVGGDGLHGGGIYNYGGPVTISNSTFVDNMSTGYGGGLLNSYGGTLSIMNSTFSANTSAYGGGGLYTDSGSVNIIDSTFVDNTSVNSGGGLSNDGGTVNVINSTFFNNNAGYPGGSSIYGGGISNTGGTMNITNSTFSANSSTGFGGGLYNSGKETITNSTFSNNWTVYDGGSLYSNGPMTVTNSILANNLGGGDCGGGGLIIDGGGNLVEEGSCGFEDGEDPQLGVLADNGGPMTPSGVVLTHALTSNSPVLHGAICTKGPSTDQRGVLRDQGDGCDIGAFEVEVATTNLAQPAPEPSVVGQPVNLSFMVTSIWGTPTGTVTVTASTQESCSTTLTNGTGGCVVTFETMGQRSLTATYSGNLNFLGSVSTSVSHTVKASTTTMLSAPPNASVVGYPIVVNFTVNSVFGTPTGNVMVSDGVNACTASLAQGQGSCSLALTTIGTRTLTASYEGSDNYLGSNSPGVGHTVISGEIFLPMVTHPLFFAGPDEVENNDYSNEANGPLVFNRDYFGKPDDSFDWFYFTVKSPGQIVITLTNHPLGAVGIDGAHLWLLLPTDDGLVVIGNTEEGPDFEITYYAEPGLYYIKVESDTEKCGLAVCTKPYTLFVSK
jgi:CSLREA domain-containing protein